MTDRNPIPTDRPADGQTVEVERIPVIEEQVSIGKRAIEGRSVRVTTRPVTERVRVSEPVARETVSVERVPVGETVAEMPAVREEGDLTVVPVVEERVRVVRELVLVEEIHLRRARSEDVHEQDVELTRTEVVIDEDER